MCIIIYNETGKAHNQKYLATAFDNNPHGVGIMWVEDGKLKTLRGLFSKKRFLKIVKDFDGVPHAIHLRWRTRGKISKEMCHPFRVSPKGHPRTMMMHNGTITSMKINSKQSDTALFAKSLKSQLKKTSTDALFADKTLRGIEKAIDSWNKLLFMREDGKVSIVNPQLWYSEDGIMYSNDYSLKPGDRKRKQALASKTKTTVYKGSGYKSSTKTSTKSSTSVTPRPSTFIHLKNGDSIRWFGEVAFRKHDGSWAKDPSLDRNLSDPTTSTKTPAKSIETPLSTGSEKAGDVRLFGDDEYIRTETGIWKPIDKVLPKSVSEDRDTERSASPAQTPTSRTKKYGSDPQLMLPASTVVRRTRTDKGEVVDTPIYPDVVQRRNLLN